LLIFFELLLQRRFFVGDITQLLLECLKFPGIHPLLFGSLDQFLHLLLLRLELLLLIKPVA
jgi:hypothetical protein